MNSSVFNLRTQGRRGVSEWHTGRGPTRRRVHDAPRATHPRRSIGSGEGGQTTELRSRSKDIANAPFWRTPLLKVSNEAEQAFLIT